MPATYETVATTTLSSSAGTITFSSIANTWTDLRIVIVPVGANGGCRLQFNADTGNSYSRTSLIYASGAVSVSNVNNDNRISLEYWGMDTSIPSLYMADIFSYAGSTFKTVLGTASEDYNGSGSTSVRVAMWSSTAAINRIDVFTLGTAFQSGTTVSIFGIKAA